MDVTDNQPSRANTDRDRYSTEALERWRRWTDAPLLVVAIASLPFLLMELRRDSLGTADTRMLDAINLFVLAAFAVDYVVELFFARDRRSYIRLEWTSLAIVLSQIIAIVPGLSGFGLLRAARGARAFRAGAVLLRLFAVGGAAAREGRQVIRKRAAGFALSMAGFTWLASAACFMLAETDSDHSIADSLWWSLSTITTVGYGDIYPVTPVGRIIGGFTMIVGISTFALVTAKIAEFLVRSETTAR